MMTSNGFAKNSGFRSPHALESDSGRFDSLPIFGGKSPRILMWYVYGNMLLNIQTGTSSKVQTVQTIQKNTNRITSSKNPVLRSSTTMKQPDPCQVTVVGGATEVLCPLWCTRLAAPLRIGCARGRSRWKDSSPVPGLRRRSGPWLKGVVTWGTRGWYHGVPWGTRLGIMRWCSLTIIYHGWATWWCWFLPQIWVIVSDLIDLLVWFADPWWRYCGCARIDDPREPVALTRMCWGNPERSSQRYVWCVSCPLSYSNIVLHVCMKVYTCIFRICVYGLGICVLLC